MTQSPCFFIPRRASLHKLVAANQIGHAMGIQSIAEFVENDDIIDVLRRIGVDHAQGHDVAKPHPMEELFVLDEHPAARRLSGT
jgi:EAL domain-containing protein (putative c-di-GMP-specific phosphodiesterase class I)